MPPVPPAAPQPPAPAVPQPTEPLPVANEEPAAPALEKKKHRHDEPRRSSHAGSSCPEGVEWIESFSQSRGMPFWKNKRTDETTFDRPNGVLIHKHESKRRR